MSGPEDTGKYAIPVRFLDLAFAVTAGGNLEANAESTAAGRAAGITWAAQRHAAVPMRAKRY
jgi:hypothetical protein